MRGEHGSCGWQDGRDGRVFMASMNLRRLTRRITCVALVALTTGGCGGDGPTAYPVQGRVTLDGAAVDRGLIRFVPAGKAAPVGGEIKAGRYELMAPPGVCRVEITWAKVVGQRKAYDTPDSPLVAVTEEAVPVRYNAQSELAYDVQAGRNEKHFELTSR